MELSTWNPESLMDMQRAIFSKANLMAIESMELSGFLAADIIQTGYGYCLYADVPGMSIHDISLTIDNGVMTISGDRKIHYDQAGDETPVLNRYRGQFYVQFSLSSQINFSKVSAVIDNGVLKVEMPVSDKSDPNIIDVPIRQGDCES